MPTTQLRQRHSFRLRDALAAFFDHLRLRRLSCALTGHSFYPSFRHSQVCLCCGLIRGSSHYRGW
jgi:hypothetical protein